MTGNHFNGFPSAPILQSSIGSIERVEVWVGRFLKNH